MAGVANVMVAPEERGRGTGRALMRALLGADRRPRLPGVRALSRHHGAVPVAGLGDRRRPEPPRDPVARAPLAGHPRRRPAAPRTTRRRPRRRPGPAAAPGRARRRRRGARRHRPGAPGAARLRPEHPRRADRGPLARRRDRFAYLAPDGFLAYRWQQGNDEILVERAVASSAAATRALWGVIASHSSIAQTVRAAAAPADPVQWLTTDPEVRLTSRARLDAAGGGRAPRPWPGGASRPGSG